MATLVHGATKVISSECRDGRFQLADAIISTMGSSAECLARLDLYRKLFKFEKQQAQHHAAWFDDHLDLLIE